MLSIENEQVENSIYKNFFRMSQYSFLFRLSENFKILFFQLKVKLKVSALIKSLSNYESSKQLQPSRNVKKRGEEQLNLTTQQPNSRLLNNLKLISHEKVFTCTFYSATILHVSGVLLFFQLYLEFFMSINSSEANKHFQG